MNLFIFCLVSAIVVGISFGIGMLLGRLVTFIWTKIKAPKYKLWVNYQPNPIGRNTFDCSIRAISKLCRITWPDALDLIVKYAKRYCDQTNCSRNLNTLLYKELDMRIYQPKKHITFEKFAHQHPTGRFALYSKNHICACIDGRLYDSWNSSTSKLAFYCSSINVNSQDKDITYDETNAFPNMSFED